MISGQIKHADSVILVFSKAPVAGEVKTRLVPYITPEQAATLHAELARDRLQMCCTAGLCEVQLWCSPDTRHPFFADCARRYGVQLRQQAGDGLGERMANAMMATLGQYRKVIIIGTDAPALGRDTIDGVLDALERNDIVLVPAEDGGYVLLGASGYQDGLLDGVGWGRGNVLAETVRNIDRLGLAYSLHGECWDVDRPEDLERYRAQARISDQMD